MQVTGNLLLFGKKETVSLDEAGDIILRLDMSDLNVAEYSLYLPNYLYVIIIMYNIMFGVCRT